MADRYAVGADSNNTNSWSTSSGGASGASVPTASDNAIWDGSSVNMTITANFTCLSATFTNYTGTLSASTTRVFTVNANLIFGVNMTDNANIVWSLVGGGSGSLTTNGYTILGGISLASSGLTLNDNITATRFGTLQALAGSSTSAVNIYVTGSLSCGRNLTLTNATVHITGASVTLTSTTSTYLFSGNLVFNTAGTIENLTAGLSLSNSTLTVTNVGTFIWTGSMTFTNSITITSGSFVFEKFIHDAGAIITINNDLLITNYNLNTNVSGQKFIGAFDIYIDNLNYNSSDSSTNYLVIPDGQTLFVNDTFVMTGQYSGIVSTTVGVDSYIELAVGCICDVIQARFRNIDASGGLKIKVLKPIAIDDCVNIDGYTDYYFDDELPAEADVEDGVTYGDVRGTEYTGSLAGGGGAMAIMT